MTLEATIARVSAIRQALADPSALVSSPGSLTGGTEAPYSSSGASSASGTAASSFADELERASTGYGEGADEGSTSDAGLDSSSGLAGSSALSSSYPYSGLSGYTGVDGYSGLDSGYSGLGGYSGLDGVIGSSALSSAGAAGQGSIGQRIVAIAESQIGQTEQPPGSNESPTIAEYRTATAGAIPGAPWCAYFASWAAREAGEPIGEGGQGAGAVSEVWSWAQSTGRAIENGPGVVPKPGDLIVFGDEHVGIVRDVLPNGDIQTIEGNYENKVAANVRTPTEATGYVEMN
jgi:hypothetical protein